MKRRLASASLLAFLLTSPAAAAELDFAIDSDFTLNRFYRDGDVAAHVLTRAGHRPRVLVAFPAGNSGAAVWFENTVDPVRWAIVASPQADREASGVRRGVNFEVKLDRSRIALREAMVGSVRSLREFERTGSLPAALSAEPEITGNSVVWQRRRLDGAPGYKLALTVVGGHVERAGERVQLTAAPGKHLHLRLRVLSGDPPLTPLPIGSLLKEPGGDPQLEGVLAFLSYREKFLAGSWRFNTYFGRDTLMSLMLLYPALRPGAVEAGLHSVLDRLNAAGEVAHEEDVGEFAVLDHIAKGKPPSAEPVFDYAMVDDDFMLLPLVARHLVDDADGRTRAAAFLDERTADGRSVRERLTDNLRFVVRHAAAFAREPIARNLVALKPGRTAGDWRDSDDGLGGGRYPYSINCALVPAALEAAAALVTSGVLGAEAAVPDGPSLHAMAKIWRERAPALFMVTREDAEARVSNFARRIGVRAPAADKTDRVRFPALSLDADGSPIPVVHSDIGFSLLLLTPSAEQLREMLTVPMRPFPEGLVSEAGLLVANPVYAPSELQPRFDRTRYHGAVVWSWQQALLKAGLQRQLARGDLPTDVRALAESALARINQTIAATHRDRAAELWTWDVVNGRFVAAPFGARSTDEDETNAAQLWSTVFLGLEGRASSRGGEPESGAAGRAP